MAYKCLGNQRITISAAIGASVVSVKELINAQLTTSIAALFNNSAAEQREFLRHIGSWVCQEGTLLHATPADVDVIYIMTDFREKLANGTGQYPSTANMIALGVPLVQAARHYLYKADLDRILVHCADPLVKLGIDVSFEI
jgi:cytochrome c biogenesis factor